MLAYRILLRAGLILLLGASVLLTACNDWETIDLSTSQSVVFSINETTVNSSGKDYEVTAPIDIRSNPELLNYLKLIETVEINHIEYTVSESSAEDISLNNGVIKTSAELDVVKARSIPFSNTSGTGEFNLNPPGVNDLSTRLKGTGYDNLKLFGRLTRTPLTCTVTVTFHMHVKARAI